MQKMRATSFLKLVQNITIDTVSISSPGCHKSRLGVQKREYVGVRKIKEKPRNIDLYKFTF